jgi:hypothetical protein
MLTDADFTTVFPVVKSNECFAMAYFWIVAQATRTARMRVDALPCKELEPVLPGFWQVVHGRLGLV